MERFHKIDVGEFTASGLKKAVKNGLVLLELQANSQEKTCRVRSFAYDRSGRLREYEPEHVLAVMGEERFMTVKASCAEAWYREFCREETWVELEDYKDRVYEIRQETVLFRNLLKEMKVSAAKNAGTHENITELYLADETTQFFGILEADFLEVWVREHPEYHFGAIF